MSMVIVDGDPIPVEWIVDPILVEVDRRPDRGQKWITNPITVERP